MFEFLFAISVLLIIFAIPPLIGVIVTLPILIPPLRRTAQMHRYFSWSLVVIFGAIAFSITYGGTLLIVIKSLVFVNSIVRDGTAEGRVITEHKTEIEQEAWRQSMLPPFVNKDCMSDEIVCVYADLPSIWGFNYLHFYALLSSAASCIFVYLSITERHDQDVSDQL